MDSSVSCHLILLPKSCITKFHSTELLVGYHDQQRNKKFFMQVKHNVFDESEFCLKALHILVKTLSRMLPKFKLSKAC